VTTASGRVAHHGRAPARAGLRLAAWALVLLSCPVAGWAQASPRPEHTSSSTIGRPAPAFQLATLDGRTVDLTTFRGKPLVINFFASWCDPCREEMPLIKELAASGARGGYGVLGIAVEDGHAAVRQYLQVAGITFPVALDSSSAVKRAYRIFGPPATFFIDAQGTIRDAVLGPLGPERAALALRRAKGEP
jgi:cytochrome c biogenesis protein CcmG/thiol:disulfide interchange protein DsbE